MAEMMARDAVVALAEAESVLQGEASIDDLRGVCRLLVRLLRDQAEADASWPELDGAAGA